MTITVNQAATWTLNIRQGEPFEIGFAFKTSADGPRESMAGYRATAQIRDRHSTASTLILDLDPYLEVDVVTDVCWLRMNSNETRLVKKSGYWDLFLVNINDANDTVKLSKGTVTVEKAVTIDD